MVISSHLKSAAVRTDNALPPFDKALFVPYKISDFNDVTRDVILEDFCRLGECNASSEELDHVASFQHDIWVISFTRREYRHGPVHQIKRACNTLRSVQLNTV